MKVEANFKQPVAIDVDREEAQALERELQTLDLIGLPRLFELQQLLIEVERRFRVREYQGPG